MLHGLKKPLYSNCVIFGPDGTMLCRCGERRMKWYLDKDLADKITDDPPAIRLRFKPAGYGDAGDPYMLADKENRCVVCGVIENLTRHHVVPYCYRIHFPEDAKSHSSYDVLPVCVSCHERYEEEARNLRKRILEELKISEFGENDGIKIDMDAVRAIRAANALIRHKAFIPEDKVVELRNRIKLVLEKEDLTDEDIEATARMEWKIVPDNYSCASKKVIDSQADLDEFAKRWRCHFLAIMNPKFMPSNWDVNKKLYKTLDNGA